MQAPQELRLIQVVPGSNTDNESPSGVPLSAVAAKVAENYGICHETAEQLKALQYWVAKMNEEVGK